MNRLTDIYLGSTHSQIVYDPLGRMTSKQADGQTVFANASYTGGNSLPPRPHALRSAETTEGVFPAARQDITYTSFDKVKTITEDGNMLEYTYGYDRQRIFLEEHANGTVRTKRYINGCERVTLTEGSNTSTKTLTYLNSPIGIFAVVEKVGSNETLHYILKDHLGSWTTITDSQGNVEQELSFDAWGTLRNAETWTGAATETPMFDRGFTGHEHLYAFGLINMNGRMYDPLMSSFLSVDAYVQSPDNAQNFNRYAYCLNNPLKYVDPSGWLMQGAMMGNSSPESRKWSLGFKLHTVSDFNNAYYKVNMAMYGNMDGPCEDSPWGSGGMGDYLQQQYGMEYYSSFTPHLVWSYGYLTNKYTDNPSTYNLKDLLDSGIKGYQYSTWWTADGWGGYQYSFELTRGTYRYGNNNYNFGHKGASDIGITWIDLSNSPENRSNLMKANLFAQIMGVPMGTICECTDLAAKSYYGVSLLKPFSGLSKPQYVNALTKAGYYTMNVAKKAGRTCGYLSAGITTIQAIDFYSEGGKGWRVGVKAGIDVIMIGVGMYGGPVGLGISIGYLVIDWATDGFGMNNKMKPY